MPPKASVASEVARHAARGRRTTLHLEKSLDIREDNVAVDFDQNHLVIRTGAPIAATAERGADGQSSTPSSTGEGRNPLTVR